MDSLGFLYVISCLLHIMTFLPLSIFSPSPSFLSSFLSSVSKTSNMMVYKSGESGHPCLFPEFRRKDFNFSPLSIILVVGLS